MRGGPGCITEALARRVESPTHPPHSSIQRLSGKEIKDEDWVKEGKLYPFPVQDDMLESDDASFTETSKKIQGILQVYRERTNLPVFVAQVSSVNRRSPHIAHPTAIIPSHYHTIMPLHPTPYTTDARRPTPTPPTADRLPTNRHPLTRPPPRRGR